MSQSIECRYARSPQAKLKNVGAELAVYIPDQKAIHVLNSTARLLFELLAEPTTHSELVEAVVYATSGDPEVIFADVREALDDFSTKGLVVEVEA